MPRARTVAPDPPAEPMRPLRLEMTNYKRIEAATIDVAGADMILLNGPNGAGKTTILDALANVIRGQKFAPAQPIRAGQATASIRLTIGTHAGDKRFELHRRWQNDGEVDRVWFDVYELQSDGTKLNVPRPQEFLEQLFTAISFDPAAFIRAAEKERLAILLDIIGASDFYEQNRTQYRSLYSERTEVNAEATRLATLLQTEHADPAPEKTLQPAATDELQRKLAEINKHNNDIDNAAVEARRLETQHADTLHEINELKAKLEKLDARAAQLSDAAAAAARFAAQPKQNRDDLTAALDECRAHDRQYEAQQKHRKTLAAQEVATKRAESLTKQLKQLDADLTQRIIDSPLGKTVPGLEMRGDGLYMNGQPFTQASAAEQRRVSAAIGVAVNPKLSMMLLDEADALDDDSLDDWRRLANEHGFSIWLTGVRLDKARLQHGCRLVEVKDGHASTTSPAADPPQAAAAAPAAAAAAGVQEDADPQDAVNWDEL